MSAALTRRRALAGSAWAALGLGAAAVPAAALEGKSPATAPTISAEARALQEEAGRLSREYRVASRAEDEAGARVVYPDPPEALYERLGDRCLFLREPSPSWSDNAKGRDWWAEPDTVEKLRASRFAYLSGRSDPIACARRDEIVTAFDRWTAADQAAEDAAGLTMLPTPCAGPVRRGGTASPSPGSRGGRPPSCSRWRRCCSTGCGPGRCWSASACCARSGGGKRRGGCASGPLRGARGSGGRWRGRAAITYNATYTLCTYVVLSIAMQIEDIPEWVPEVVRVVAVGYGMDNVYLRRFLTDPRMEGVWSYLMDQPIVEGGIERGDFDRSTLVVNGLPARAIRPNEHACAILYRRMMMHTGRIIDGKIIAWSRAGLKKEAQHYKSVLDALPIIRIPSPATFGQPLNPKLLEAMRLVEEHCKQTHNMIMQENNPYVINNDKSDANVKSWQSWTRGTAVLMKMVWGEYKYGISAKMMNVVFGLDDKTITDKKVEGWCKGLPSGFSY